MVFKWVWLFIAFWAGAPSIVRRRQELVDLDCSTTRCEQQCVECASSSDYELQDCLSKLPQGCAIQATVMQTNVSPLYSCTLPHLGRALAIPYLTLNAQASLAIVSVHHFRACQAMSPMRGGRLSRQEMRTCSISSSGTEPLPVSGVGDLFVDISQILAPGTGEFVEFVKILDPCAHEQDKVAISILIETGQLEGIGTLEVSANAVNIDSQPPDVLYSCPASGLFGVFATSRMCMKPLEFRIGTSIDRDEVPAESTHWIFLRVRQLFLLAVAVGMICTSYLYYTALKKEMARSQAAREVVRGSKLSN
eukprot:Gregarina_sp_Poly_1__3168@NODE_189_length_11663_cov_119_423594_g168_i0_p4_GENE_NODE_189_length_11663_cov_119_423594_g168_i0NODE_189_length_11663_cov_119_423594_g168_i0_p4_ORF_typecomplete_len307_score24_70_NODE_189_length_11663_cov_119_423594_g168_i047085628